MMQDWLLFAGSIFLAYLAYRLSSVVLSYYNSAGSSTWDLSMASYWVNSWHNILHLFIETAMIKKPSLLYSPSHLLNA